ncbi:RNHCP domain-containing protein [Candidatus Peregrinibacteria bacterium]|nr:RNHCP domain-containing protein [Candidatus Peregrinibacteria bacterium]
MNFISLNESFQCLNCSARNVRHPSSCRNHCTQCLYSRHLDAEFPGDRASACEGLMAPTNVTRSGKKGWILLHKCLKCGVLTRNKMADDDNMTLAAEISKNPLK